MSTTVRAGIAVGLLIGFYVVVFGILGGLAAFALWLWQAHPGTAAAKVSYLVLALGAAILAALWKVLRAKPAPPAGVLVDERRAPELWATVRGLAAAVQTRAPDEIRLIPEVNAAVSEDATMLGLRAGRRYLYLGVPLLQGFTVSQLRGVLAHELGHYSHSHTRLGALSYRGRMTIVRTIQEIGVRSIPGWILRGYARLYLLAESAVSRRQEFEADQASVRIAGRATAMGMMRELQVVDKMWHFFLNAYVGWGWEAGYAPRGVFVGFHELLTARGAAAAKLREEPIEEERSRWDSHPPTADRIAAMAAMPDVAVAVDNRPAIALLPDPGSVLYEVETTMLDLRGRTVLPWEELTPTAARALVQRDCDVLFRAAARVARRDRGDLATVLDLLAAGRADELARATHPHEQPEDAREALVASVADAIRLAAAGSDAGGWRHSWSGPVRFVDRTGEEFPADEIARLAAEPSTMDKARAMLGGLNLGAATQIGRSATAEGADVLGGLADVKVGDQSFDVLILDRGLVFVPSNGKSDQGRQRLRWLIQSAPVAELARRHWFLPYEEIAVAKVLKQIPVRVELTLHNGQSVSLRETWGGEDLGKGSRDVLLAAVAPFVAAGKD
jgi:Zn-dependent protease with chaperone function